LNICVVAAAAAAAGGGAGGGAGAGTFTEVIAPSGLSAFLPLLPFVSVSLSVLAPLVIVILSVLVCLSFEFVHSRPS
jgi:hypothetical protein